MHYFFLVISLSSISSSLAFRSSDFFHICKLKPQLFQLWTEFSWFFFFLCDFLCFHANTPQNIPLEPKLIDHEWCFQILIMVLLFSCLSFQELFTLLYILLNTLSLWIISSNICIIVTIMAAIHYKRFGLLCPVNALKAICKVSC